ncbi:MAG: AAA family ATPase, partial [Clostridia bacterium]|nr:AAA family ATPase [Clostridia bacterium]
YLLDEPENSLSPQRQQELLGFLEDSVRFFGCQFIIATHSPFLLSMRGARVYDLDEDPVRIRRWTQLPAVRAYYDFFRRHASAFEDGDD